MVLVLHALVICVTSATHIGGDDRRAGVLNKSTNNAIIFRFIHILSYL